jgi:hypothetical protein
LKDKNNMKKHKDRALCHKLSQKHKLKKKKKKHNKRERVHCHKLWKSTISIGCQNFMHFVQSLGFSKAQEMYMWVQLGTKFFWAQFVMQKQIWVTIGLMRNFFMPTLAKHKVLMLSDNFIVVKIQNLKNYKKFSVKWLCV